MKVMSYITFVLFIGSIVFLHFVLRNLVKQEDKNTLDKNDLYYLGGSVLGAGLFSFLTILFLVLSRSWSLSVGEYFLALGGGFFFGLSFAGLYGAFGLNFYKPKLEEHIIKIVRIVMYSLIPVVFLSFILATEGVAEHLVYPLANRLSLVSGFVGPFESGVQYAVAFYGIFIVGGAILVYFIADHFFYKKFKRHGILDTTFYIAFPSGIVGARLWYCYVLEFDKYKGNFLDVLRIWDGGLAIMGGAILGIIAGVTYMLLKRKYVNIRWAMDVVVPTILIAQAVGRMGNFFNLEVHGKEVLASSWSFLPNIVLNNMVFSSTSGPASPGNIYLPLFLIELIINLSGYFLITFAVGRGLKKYISLGDLSMSYLIWYGLTRAVLEPLRDAHFEYSQSWYSSFLLIGAGVVGIVAFHLYDFYRKKKGLPPRTYDTV
ncbi:MAG: prolipoprotein diacylglyceryl transferase [Bacilli bacterium]|jgi:phosphatidylglycerol:prolipoprotein diacylglycerol transferase|nr:prolipoprotein diacylglyceryl transferase [Bacilli bacterium]